MMENKNRNAFQAFLVFLSVLLAVVLMTVFFLQYRSARRELSELKADLVSSTAAWKQINEEKLIIQRKLKAAKENLREATLVIEEAEEKTKEIEADIEELEKEIEILKSEKPPSARNNLLILSILKPPLRLLKP